MTTLANCPACGQPTVGKHTGVIDEPVLLANDPKGIGRAPRFGSYFLCESCEWGSEAAPADPLTAFAAEVEAVERVAGPLAEVPFSLTPEPARRTIVQKGLFSWLR